MQCDTRPHSVNISGQFLDNGAELGKHLEGPSDRILFGPGFDNTLPLLWLSVRNNGPGIPSDILTKIFQPYFTTKAPGTGTGLGLAIVHRLLKDAHGCLHVHSQSGEGSTFNIYLPVFIRPPSSTN